MEMTTIGNPDEFAIEYKIEDPSPVYGHARVWIHGAFIGDFRRTIPFYLMCCSLDSIMRRDNEAWRIIYRDAHAVPSDEYFYSQPGWSWGDAFDDFFLAIYLVESERKIHFLWELESSRSHDFPGYPLGRHHDSVSFEVYNEVVSTFLGREEVARAFRSQQ